MLSKTELLKILTTFKNTGQRGNSLLDRAKEYLLEDPLLFKYWPTVSVVKGKVYGSCKCPYYQRTGKICKHIVAQLIYMHRELLKDEPEWQEFMQKHKQALRRELNKFPEEVPRDFANF